MARKLNDYPLVALKPEDLQGGFNLIRVFGRSGPLHIEIGIGKAAFLLKQAKAQPNINFLGIEQANKYYRYAVDRIGRWTRATSLKGWTGSSLPKAGLSNVRIIRTDAAVFLAEAMPADSVDCFHIYFPDPWPKKRHHKRRFLCPANLENLIRCLRTGGTLRIVTDHAEYFEQILKLLADRSDQLERIKFLPDAGANNGELTGTNYERKYLKAKRQIYTLAARKKGGLAE